jgi:SSS family solute:Na+ symporter
MPEYLEYRYSPGARALMSVLTVVVYVLVTTAAVLYSGATTLSTVFGVRLEAGVLLIAALAVLYTTWGGLLAAVWADLLQGSALLVGGLLTLAIGLHAVGGVGPFLAANADRLHMVLPRTHPELPWTVLVGGMWIPIFYYCGLNQFIVQRALGAGSLKQAQLGVVFAAALWLLVPFGIVMPGIVAHQLYGAGFTRPDEAYPTLVRELVPTGVRGFLFAALAGAVISTLASVLNSASTIFTMDLYRRHLRPEASEATLVAVGRWATVVFLIFGCAMALSPLPRGGVFAFIQEFQGYISPGILAAFLVGFVVPTTPPAAGITALAASAPIYGLLRWQFGGVAYLHRMLFTFGALVALMLAVTALAPLPAPRRLPERAGVDMRGSRAALAIGLVVIACVSAFFIAFR